MSDSTNHSRMRHHLHTATLHMDAQRVATTEAISAHLEANPVAPSPEPATAVSGDEASTS